MCYVTSSVVDSMPRPVPKRLSHTFLLLCGSALQPCLVPAVGFYHRLLRPNVHYVPVWQKRPEEILDAVRWAREHDAEAHKIARAGAAFAQHYLDARARACYWLTLLQRYAASLNYQPSLADAKVSFGYVKPLGEWLGDKVAPVDPEAAVQLLEKVPSDGWT